MFAPRCSHPSCRRQTKDASGRCFSHRGLLADLRSRMGRGVIEVALLDGSLPTTSETGRGTTTHFRNSRGTLSRTDGPAVIEREKDGTVVRETWYLDGVEHRLGGPAETGFYSNGDLARERWYLSGHFSRIDGPAVIDHDPLGGSSWYIAGKLVSGPEGLAEKLPDVSFEDAEEAFRASPLAPLLDEGRSHGEIAEVISQGVFTLEGVRAVLEGSPAEWARAFEESA